MLHWVDMSLWFLLVSGFLSLCTLSDEAAVGLSCRGFHTLGFVECIPVGDVGPAPVLLLNW